VRSVFERRWRPPRRIVTIPITLFTLSELLLCACSVRMGETIIPVGKAVKSIGLGKRVEEHFFPSRKRIYFPKEFHYVMVSKALIEDVSTRPISSASPNDCSLLLHFPLYPTHLPDYCIYMHSVRYCPQCPTIPPPIHRVLSSCFKIRRLNALDSASSVHVQYERRGVGGELGRVGQIASLCGGRLI
jgi:hypothetical protein